MHMSCFSPEERLLPPSSISKLRGSVSYDEFWFSPASPSVDEWRPRLSK